MHVKDRLPGIPVRVHDGAIAGLSDPLSMCDVRGNQRQPAYEFRIAGIVERRDMVARNDHDMDGRLGIDVAEGDAVLRLRHDGRGNLLSHDPAKETISHCPFSPFKDIDRITATAAMPAVSKRSVVDARRALRQPRKLSASSSSGSIPPSGPNNTVG